MQIVVYTDDKKYNMHLREYQIIWEAEGKKIEDAFYNVLGLHFKENTINLLINSGKDGSNYSGNNENEPMNFRFNNRCKIGTYLHELSHRIVMEYNLFEIAKDKLKINDIHELIDLFLYDIIKLLYGDEAAKLRVEYESGFEEEVYKKSWDEALLLSYEERQNIIKELLEEL